MDAIDYKPFDINALGEKECVVVSSEHALEDVVPVKWEDKVVSGHEKVLLVADGGSLCAVK